MNRKTENTNPVTRCFISIEIEIAVKLLYLRINIRIVVRNIDIIVSFWI